MHRRRNTLGRISLLLAAVPVLVVMLDLHGSPMLAWMFAPFVAAACGLGLIIGLAGLWWDAVGTGAFIGVVLNLVGLGIALWATFAPPFRVI